MEHSKRLNLRERIREIEFTLTGSDFESQFLLYRLLRDAFPETYGARLRLRPAPLIKLHLENQFPRASVTTRLGKLQSAGSSSGHTANVYYGPFFSRVAAEKFANDALDFFKMRRCVDDLHPDPAFPGCVYSEMKMCLAPCFKGCADEEYAAEVSRVQAFLNTQGESLVRELAEQRDRASADLAFEEAAAVHAKWEKLRPLISQLPEIIRRIDDLRALIVLPGATGHVEVPSQSVSLFSFENCALHGPVPFSVAPVAESRSMESRVEEAIASFSTAEPATNTERSEHLSLLRRWYYRSTRVGEIFFADQNRNWPMRRIVRGIGRVAKGEKSSEGVPTFSAAPGLPSTS